MKIPATLAAMMPTLSAILAVLRDSSLTGSSISIVMRVKPPTYTAPPQRPTQKHKINIDQSYLKRENEKILNNVH